jgi:predicted ABC-type ATPase
MTAPPVSPAIFVLAGPNGAGKSSIGGAIIRANGADYYNPDEATARLAAANPQLSQGDANALAWRIGRDRLAAAIASRSVFAFETTLGGASITEILLGAARDGVDIHIWYAALASADAHVARVRARVAAGGHGIPEETIRARYDRSRMNLIRLLPVASSVRVFDNSAPADPQGTPSPELLLEMQQGRIMHAMALARVPAWARPIMMAALRVDARQMR